MFKKISERIFPLLIALSALSVSASAAFYSISGLSKLFAGAAFAMMVVFAVVDIVTGINGKELHVQEYIYNSFVIIALGSFGIAEAGKIFGKKNNTEE